MAPPFLMSLGSVGHSGYPRSVEVLHQEHLVCPYFSVAGNVAGNGIALLEVNRGMCHPIISNDDNRQTKRTQPTPVTGAYLSSHQTPCYQINTEVLCVHLGTGRLVARPPHSSCSCRLPPNPMLLAFLATIWIWQHVLMLGLCFGHEYCTSVTLPK